MSSNRRLGLTRTVALASLSALGALGSVTLLSSGTSGAVSTSSEGHAPRSAATDAQATNPGHGKKGPSGAETSQDWAGYAVTGPSFSNVAGSWVQPTATCPKNQLQEAAFWVGIDGYSASDPTVQQIGTDSDCTKEKGKSGGGPNYYAWYQLYPQSDVVLSTTSYPVAPGDPLTASVSVSGSVYTLSIADGAKWHFSTSQTPTTQPLNSSAEWITEAPCTGSHCKILPLADFGTVGFTGASANDQAISYSGFTGHQIDMTSKSGKKTKAQASALSGGGSAFSVDWLSN